MSVKTLTQTLCSTALAASVGFVALPSQAADFTVTTSGIWTAIEGRPDLTFSGLGTDTVLWGIPIPSSGPQSGLEFEGNGPLGVDIDEKFKVGTLTHFNNPITFNSAATLATLKLTLDLGTAGIQDFSFDFDVDETPNGGDENGLCEVGSIPCPDIIKFPETGFAEESFIFDGMRYTLQLTNFMDEDGNDVIDFISPENDQTSAMLFAIITKAPDIPPTAPEPMTIAGLGLLGIYFLSGFRAKKVD